MSKFKAPALEELIERLSKLPGLGRKSATRLSLFFLRQPEDEVRALAQSLVEVKEKIRFCSLCHNFTDEDPCPRCSDPRRDRTSICVVETPGDLLALESGGFYQGLYHVLGGALAPLSGVGPAALKIEELLKRVDESGQGEAGPRVLEVLLATGSSPEGEATSSYLAARLKERGSASPDWPGVSLLALIWNMSTGPR